jgi:hypothetical protein
MTEEIKLFEKDIGTWDGEIEVRPQPGAEPQRSTGVMVNRVVGGRWLVSDFKNEVSGFEGHGVYGWDVAKQKYVGTWVDPMRSSLVIAEGAFDEATREMTYRFELTMNGRTMRWRDVTKFIDDDTQEFRSILELAPGSDHEVLRATYRRRR